MRRWLVVAAAVLIAAWGAYRNWLWRPLHHGPGVLAAEEPQQTPAGTVAPFTRGTFEITPIASYRLRVRLLSRHPYHFGREADLAPLDFAIGWGPMSDSALLDRLDIQQSARFFTLHWSDPALSADEILDHAANMHLIPADSNVAHTLDRMRPGEIIELEGYLVSVKDRDGWSWRSSLTRTDRGAGACELMWVEHARSS